jgi:hypothetical protein
MVGLVLLAVALATWVGTAAALDADDLSELLGYTMVAASNVDDEFEGAEPDKVVRLDNGMVFQFDEYNYAYAYRPSVAVFAEYVTASQMLEAGISKPPAAGMTLYKLVIDDEIYDAHRLK